LLKILLKEKVAETPVSLEPAEDVLPAAANDETVTAEKPEA